jgi:2-polyprenyl-3-methyl-5-hydroxy-6-metoxy-1,4-benzoquinol methylase
MGHTVVGIDRDPQASTAPWYASFHVVDLARLSDLGEAPFDVIIAGDVLEHLVDPDRALAALGRLLTPDGRLLLSVPNVAFVAIRLLLLSGRFEYAERGIMDASHLRFYTRRSLLQLVRATGLATSRLIGVPPPLPLVSPRFLHWPWRAAYELAAAAARARPTLLAYQFVLEVRR